MIIESPNFVPNGKIPRMFSCDGEDISPNLVIKDVPGNAESLVLLVDDPDAPSGGFTHWLLWDIDANTTEIPEDSVPDSATEGINSQGTVGYVGPCPPEGEIHHYHFRLYALDTMLFLDSGTKRDMLFAEMNGHILAEAESIGIYQRGGWE